MIEPITYSLRLAFPNSDTYYRVIASFADRWLEHASSAVEECVGGFQAYRQSIGLARRSFAEYAFEMLVLGVLLREHGGEATRLPTWKVRLLTRLVQWQGRLPWTERVIKQLRGWLASTGAQRSQLKDQNHDVPHLLDWLRAQGRDVQARRLAEWQGYFQSIGAHQAQAAVDQCLLLADCFEEESMAALGPYTAGVARFLAEVVPTYRRRYDVELVSRPRLEYHLGMLGTEVLNRAYRERFIAARHKIVIVPPCMRAQPEEECKAIQTPFGARCQACTPTCRIHQISQLGKKHGFDVFIMPDELGRFGGGGRREEQIGVVGVACVLTNWNGGWQTAEMDISAQGVLLDYVGCSYHWHERGIPTDANLPYLRQVVTGSSDDMSGM